MDIRLPASGNIRVWFAPGEPFSNWRSPTAGEINAMLDISDAVSWNDMGFGLSSSNTNSDPAITAKGQVSDRGATQYGGTMSLYYPKVLNDVTNKYALVRAALKNPRTLGYIVVRVDGEELYTDASTAAQPGRLANTGDIVGVYRVMTDGYADSVTGEEAFRYTVTFISQGRAEPRTVVRTTGSAVTIAPATSTGLVGSRVALTGFAAGRKYTRALKWTSSAPNIATVSSNGIVTRRAVGTATITATWEQAGVSATHAATVTAA